MRELLGDPRLIDPRPASAGGRAHADADHAGDPGLVSLEELKGMGFTPAQLAKCNFPPALLKAVRAPPPLPRVTRATAALRFEICSRFHFSFEAEGL